MVKRPTLQPSGRPRMPAGVWERSDGEVAPASRPTTKPPQLRVPNAHPTRRPTTGGSRDVAHVRSAFIAYGRSEAPDKY